jgi:hypothetical protein
MLVATPTSAATAKGGLEYDGHAVLLAELLGVLPFQHWASTAGHNWNAYKWHFE